MDPCGRAAHCYKHPSYSSVGQRDASCLIWSFKIQTVPSFLFFWLFLKFSKVQSEQKSELPGYVRVSVASLLVRVATCHTVSLRPARSCGELRLARPAVLVAAGARGVERCWQRGQSPWSSGPNVVLSRGAHGARGEFPPGCRAGVLQLESPPPGTGRACC